MKLMELVKEGAISHSVFAEGNCNGTMFPTRSKEDCTISFVCNECCYRIHENELVEQFGKCQMKKDQSCASCGLRHECEVTLFRESIDKLMEENRAKNEARRLIKEAVSEVGIIVVLDLVKDYLEVMLKRKKS
jgi:hypothetical protein